MVGHGRADSFAITSDEVHNTRRNAGFFTSFDEIVSREWRIFSRFEYDGVSANQRGDEFPGRDRHRKVPRRNQTANTDRLAHAHRKLVAHLSGTGESVQTSPFAGGVVSAIDCFLNVAAGFFQHLTHFASHVRGEFFLVANQDLTETEKHFGAFWCGRVAPAIERSLRGVNGGMDVVASGKRKATN